MFRIKICGVTTPDDARAAVEAGADALGLNFFPQSPRFVPPAQATEIAGAIPSDVARVGVFVEPEPRAAREIADRLALEYVQLHGQVTPEPFDELGPARVIVAMPFSERRVAGIRASVASWRASGRLPAALLLDADRAGQHGGTGATIDWELAAELVRELPDLPVVLAGGLTPENVGQAVSVVRPHAVDVASGVESSPGRKDGDKLRRFMAACAALRG